MRLGLHALGIGTGARREIIDAVARQAETRGFRTLWCGEHVVMVDEPASPYPYTPDKKIAVPAAADWLDPTIALAFAAAATETIRLATGVLLLPEHNPVIMAKQAASLDRLCGGRLTLGVGVGWSREEFDALGVPFARRGARTDAYVEAVRALWRDEITTHRSEFVAFENIRVNPKPTAGRIPLVVGGNSDRALRRVVGWGDGWCGFNLDDVDAVADRIDTIDRICLVDGRARDELDLAVALRNPDPADRNRLAALGIDELVLVESPPEDADAVPGWLDELADRWEVEGAD
ncbi:LLM class F420-dependent oxidoreductase [Gordonia lacunae]|uniref:LLM class F420-dependent oxidoreductase n=1 Tax=Gordonia lacunae TaxID=417102 RepID=UPI0039E4BA72